MHERYHPAKHNPWNEIECGDHYARGMASWGVLLGLSGFGYHGPQQHLSLAPRLTPEAFRCAFTAAEGWGTVSQQRKAGVQHNDVEVRWGTLPLSILSLQIPAGSRLRQSSVSLDGQPLQPQVRQLGDRVELTLPQPTTIRAGQKLSVELTV